MRSYGSGVRILIGGGLLDVNVLSVAGAAGGGDPGGDDWLLDFSDEDNSFYLAWW